MAKTYIFAITNKKTGYNDSVPVYAKNYVAAYAAVKSVYDADYNITIKPKEVLQYKVGSGIYCD